MEVGVTTNILTARLPILNPGDYDLWLMRIEQYFLMTDYSLWEVIKNGNKVLRRTVGTVEQEYEPTTAEEKQDRRNEIKERATLLMALPNKDQLKFHSCQDAKITMEAIAKDNDGIRIPKETLEKSSIGIEDSCLNLEEQASSSTSQNSQMVTFVSNSTNNTNNTNKANDTAHGVSTTHTQEDLEQLYPDDLEEMDLQWEMAMLTIRARWFIKRTWKKLDINGQRENKGIENNSRTVPIESSTQNALIAQDGIGGYDWSYQAEEEQPTNHALMAFTSSGSSSSSDSDIDSCSKTCVNTYDSLKEQYDNLEYSYLRKPDLTFMDEIVESENLDVTTVVTPCNDKTVENKGVSNIVKSNAIRMNNTHAPIIKDWNSDDESEIDYTVRPSTKKIKYVKTVRETDAPKQNKQHPKGNQRNWNNLMS
ncbi:hypothetical protein Tco_0673817 [Tanacetum coccineum]